MPQLGYILNDVTASQEYQSIATICKEIIRVSETELSPNAHKNLTMRVRLQVNQLFKAGMVERKEVSQQNIIQYYYRKCLKNY